MKWVILLIIANIGTFIWTKINQETISSEGLLGLSDIDKIQLVEEVRPKVFEDAKQKNKLYTHDADFERGLAKGKAVNKQLSTAPAQTASCQRIEYFKTESLVKRAQKILFLQTIASTINKVDNMAQTLGYFTLIEPAKSLKRAKAKFKALKDEGFTDLWLFRSGELKYGISLGFFTSEKKAKAFSDKLKDKEIETVIKPKVEKSTLYYLTFNQSTKDKIDLSILEKTLQLEGKLNKMACDD